MTTSTFYIWNTKTDEHFDTNEMRFYGANWEIDDLESKEYLEGLISNDPEKFENCIVVDKNA